MWGKTENQAPPAPPAPPAPARPVAEPVGASPIPSPAAPPGVSAFLGPSLVIKAEVSGHEDLCLDGRLEGSIALRDHNLIVGVHGRINADVTARNVYIEGELKGKVVASERVEIRKTGSLIGDVTTGGVTIEDGAYFKGSIDIVKG